MWFNVLKCKGHDRRNLRRREGMVAPWQNTFFKSKAQERRKPGIYYSRTVHLTAYLSYRLSYPGSTVQTYDSESLQLNGQSSVTAYTNTVHSKCHISECSQSGSCSNRKKLALLLATTFLVQLFIILFCIVLGKTTSVFVRLCHKTQHLALEL